MTDLAPTKDTWLLQRVGGTTNYGNGDGDYFHVGPIPPGDAGNDWKSRGFLEFDVAATLSALTAVTSATLELTVAPNDCITGGRGSTIRIFAEKCSSTFGVRVVGANCAFESCTNNQCWPGPSVDTANRAFHSSGSHSTGDKLQWDLTAMLEAARVAGDSVLTLRLIAANSGGTAYDEATTARRIAFWAVEAATSGNRPKLSITGSTGSTNKSVSDTNTSVTETASKTVTGSGTVDVSDSGVGTDTLVKAAQTAYFTTILTEADEGVGQLTFPVAASEALALLSSVTEDNISLTCKFAANKTPHDGQLVWQLIARALDSNNYYYFNCLIRRSQQMDGVIGKVVAGVDTEILRVNDIGTFLSNVNFWIRFQCLNVNPTGMSVKIWREDTEPPAWQLITQDAEASLQGNGTVGLGGYVTTITNAPIVVTFDKFEGQSIA